MNASRSEESSDDGDRSGFEQALRELAAELAPHDHSAGVLPPGTVVGGHFEVLRRLGSGGMGVVHVARDIRLGRTIALKLVRNRELGRDAQRLEREARAMALLADPNVVVVFEVGRHDDGVYVAMELVDGGSAREWATERPRTTNEIVDTYLQAARGLAAAHAAGLVHRDFKPDNVLVGKDRRVRVGDFGLARSWNQSDDELRTASGVVLDATTRATTHSQTDAIAGTVGYLAPELCLGHPQSPSSDQFAFGVALFEVLFERRPFRGKAPTLDDGIEPPLDDELPRRVPGWLRRLVLRTLAFDPAARYPSMNAVVDALERGRGRARNRLFGIVGAAALLVVAGVGVAIGERTRERPCADAESIAARVWNDADRSAIDSAVVGDPAATQAIWSVAAPMLDDWTARWIEERRDTCLATRVHGSQSEALLDRSIACLDDRLADLEVLVETLADDAGARARADSHASALRDPTPCRDHTYLSARVAPLVDPDERAEAERIANETRRLQLGRRTIGDLPAQAERAAALLDDAKRLGHAPTIALVEIQQAFLAYERDDHDEARDRWHSAVLGAGGAGDDDTSARAALNLAYLAGVDGEDAGAARAWLDIVEIGLTSGRVDPELRGGLELTRSQLLQGISDFDGAVAAARRAVELAVGQGDPYAVIVARSELAAALDGAGDHRAAIVEYDTAIADITARYGDDLPRLSTLLGNRGLAHYYSRQNELAIADQRRALAIDLAHAGETSSAASTMLNLGLALADHGQLDEGVASLERGLQVYRRLGARRDEALVLDALGWTELEREEPARALVHFREALELRLALAPEQQGELAESHRHVGDAQMKLGAHADALASYRESLAASDLVDPTHPFRAWPLYGIARASNATGAFADAATSATAVIELAQRRQVDPIVVANARFELAQAWWRIDARPEALDEARRARAEMLPHLGEDHVNLVEIDDWLRERGAVSR